MATVAVIIIAIAELNNAMPSIKSIKGLRTGDKTQLIAERPNSKMGKTRRCRFRNLSTVPFNVFPFDRNNEMRWQGLAVRHRLSVLDDTRPISSRLSHSPPPLCWQYYLWFKTFPSPPHHYVAASHLSLGFKVFTKWKIKAFTWATVESIVVPSIFLTKY